jgi:PHD/YefM family antitoxin component YafN of YafNO toxin-antitoxin module
MMDWRIEDAENQLGTVIDRALSEGPQTIRREDAAVVVVKEEDYERLLRKRSFKDHLLNGPSFEGLDLTRDKSLPREVDFGPE